MGTSLSYDLHVLTTRLDRAADRILRAELGVPYRRYLALLMVGDLGAATQRALADGGLINWTEPAQPHPGRRPGHRAGTFGSSTSGSASRNWPSVAGCRCSCQGSW